MKKKILGISLVTAAALTSLSALADVQFEGKKFLVVPMGKSVTVLPAELQSTISLEPGYRPNCAEIISTIESREANFTECAAHPERSFCKVMVRSIRLMAEGRADEESEQGYAQRKLWRFLHQDTKLENESGLKAMVARLQKVKAEKVSLELGGIPLPSGPVQIDSADDSLVSRVSKLIRFTDASMVGYEPNGQHLVTRNNLLACDILAKKAVLGAPSTTYLRNVDTTPREVVNSAWEVYQRVGANLPEESLSPMEKAASIGFEIAIGLGLNNKSEQTELTPAALFTKFFSVNGRDLKLRSFDGMRAFQEGIYPDQISTATVTRGWRFQ